LVDGNHTGMFQLNEEKLVNIKHCKRKAKELMEAGEERWGTDEETFNRIFSLEDHTSLRIIYNEYVKLSQRDIMNSVDRETSGDLRKGLLAIAQVIKHRPMFFADKLYKSMKGLGTNDDDLIRIVVTRSEMDMVQIKECFLEKYKQTLWNFIKDDTSGDYRKLLLGLVGKN
jgi:annexin A7/11